MSEIAEIARGFGTTGLSKLRQIWKRLTVPLPKLEPKPEPKQDAKPVEEWMKECQRWHGRVLTSAFRHYCPDWDFLPIDTSLDEFGACTCEYPDVHSHNWLHMKSGKLYRIIEHRLVVLESDLTELVLYSRWDGSGPIWARPAAEFFDGRFKRISD